MSIPVMYHLILERISRHVLPRIPEPELVMLDPLQNAAFLEAGSEDGYLAFLYLYHALQISPLVRHGDKVLDLACGPANQLAQIARINPQSHFVGLDASVNMLDRARTTLSRYELSNVELVLGNMTRLTTIEDASMDCVICTMSLHHLPNLEALSSTMREVRRVLKQDGKLYFADFGRLKRASTQRYFSEDQRDCRSAPFTQDYINSLRAAFSVDELSNAVAVLGSNVERHLTPLAPFMIIFKSATRRKLDTATRLLAQGIYRHMSVAQQKDFKALTLWFQRGGYDLPCELA